VSTYAPIWRHKATRGISRRCLAPVGLPTSNSMPPKRRDDFLNALDATRTSLFTGLGELITALGRWVEANPEAVAKILLWLQESERRQVSPDGSSGRSFLELILPANWIGLRAGVLEKAQQVMVETGVCLAWAPNAQVIEALVRAPDEATRDKELLRHATLILEDLEAVLAEVESPYLGELKEGLSQAVVAYRAGLPMPAQAMAAAIVTTVLEGHYGFEHFKNARQSFGEERPEAAGIWSSRRASVQWAIRMSILNQQHRPIHGRFNRHLTAHDLDSGQYDEVNALTGLLLAGGSLRELQEMYWLAERGGAVSYSLRPLGTNRPGALRAI